MSKKTAVLVIVLTGLVWGLTEIFLGDAFYKLHIPFRSATLTAVGLCLLVVARLALDRPGTSLAAGVISGLVRCLVPKVYICHAVAIAIEACAFDATWTALKAGERQTLRRAWIAGAVAVYSGYLAFGLVSIYFFKFGKWVAGGLSGVGLYMLRSGSFAVGAFIILAPLAIWAGRRLAARLPRLAESGLRQPRR
jgi:thiamine transporter ThiT